MELLLIQSTEHRTYGLDWRYLNIYKLNVPLVWILCTFRQVFNGRPRLPSITVESDARLIRPHVVAACHSDRRQIGQRWTRREKSRRAQLCGDINEQIHYSRRFAWQIYIPHLGGQYIKILTAGFIKFVVP